MDEILYTNPLSYATVLRDLKKFKKSGTNGGDDFNIFDTPAHHFFKIFFYFSNGDVEGESNDSGLLAPSWQLPDVDNLDTLSETNTAWAYLMQNGEIERADKLKSFIQLLSTINTESPWYFNSVGGLEAALERKQTRGDVFKIDEERRKITITCLPDAYDERIGTLLDLYKEIVWSWQLKREVVPANLRKFDMGIYIFSSPISNIIRPKSPTAVIDATFDQNSSNYITSYKYFEFHNCEIDYNSSISGNTSLNNEEGNQSVYTINIYFDDCYETRYNEFMMKTIGDMIAIDSAKVVFEGAISSLSKYDDVQPDVYARGKQAVEELYDRVTYDYTETPEEIVKEKLSDELKRKAKEAVTNAAKEVVGAAVGWVANKVNSFILGNLFTGSLTQIYSQLQQTSKGHISSTLYAVDQYANGNYSPERTKQLGNLYKAASAAVNI